VCVGRRIEMKKEERRKERKNKPNAKFTTNVM
jgi:hypothetical protein